MKYLSKMPHRQRTAPIPHRQRTAPIPHRQRTAPIPHRQRTTPMPHKLSMIKEKKVPIPMMKSKNKMLS